MMNLKERLDAVSDIMTLPDVVARINAMVRDPRTSASNITSVISNDIALSAKVLRLVNSPFYGFNRRITSINYAIVILGFNAIRNLAFSAFMHDMYRAQIPGFDSREFWRFAISCAAGAQALVAKLGLARGDDAFMGGLLHDIGLVIMIQYFPEDFQKALDCSLSSGVSLLEAENIVLDYDHRKVGEILLDRWNLPEGIAGVCGSYVDLPDGEDKLAAVVHLAHILSCALCLGNPGDRYIPALLPQALLALGVNQDRLPELADTVLKAGRSVEGFMDI